MVLWKNIILGCINRRTEGKTHTVITGFSAGGAVGDVLRSFRAPQFKNEVDRLDSKKIDQTSESYDFWRRREHTEVIKLTKKKKKKI